MSPHRTATGLALVILLGAPAARADERPVDEAVSVARGDECLEHAHLVQHIATWLPAGRVDARLSAVVEGEGAGASFVVLRDGGVVAARRFDRLPGRCADRRAALGLAIALALDAAVLDGLLGARAEPVPPPAPERERERDREPGPAPPEAPAPPDPPVPQPSVALEVAAEVQLLAEVMPGIAVGLQIGPRLVLRDVVEVAARAWVSSVSDVDLGEGRVSVQLAGGRLEGCARRRVDRLILRGCAGGAAGAAHGRGRDVQAARATTVGFAGALLRLGVAFEVDEWLALELAVDGWLSLWRPRFDLVDRAGDPVASAELPVGGTLVAAGIAVRF